MPRIKSLLNGEVSNVRADIAREMIKLGVAVELEPEPPPEAKFNPITRQHEIPSGARGSSWERSRQSLIAHIGRAPVPQPTWTISIEKYDDTKDLLCVRMAIGAQVSLFFGHPKDINAKFPGTNRYINGFGREVPADTVKLYSQQWKAAERLRLPEHILNPDRTCNENVAGAEARKQADESLANNSFLSDIKI